MNKSVIKPNTPTEKTTNEIIFGILFIDKSQSPKKVRNTKTIIPKISKNWASNFVNKKSVIKDAKNKNGIKFLGIFFLISFLEIVLLKHLFPTFKKSILHFFILYKILRES